MHSVYIFVRLIYIKFPSVQNEVTRQEIISLAQAKDLKELENRLCSRMEFGTAGDSSSSSF